jgi:hypothetical protein
MPPLPPANKPVTKDSQAFPPSNTPVVVAEKVVQSRNLFLTSNDLIPPQGNGQNYTWNLGNDAITTRAPAQYIRLTLLNFNMYKTWNMVNITNNMLVAKLNGVFVPFQVPSNNYASVKDLGQAFGEILMAFMQTSIGGGIGTLTLDATAMADATPLGTSTQFIDFTINDPSGNLPTEADISNNVFNVWSPIDTTNASWNIPAGGLQTATEGGDSAILLGGDRVSFSEATFKNLNTFNIIGDASGNFIRLRSKYPAQRFTEPNVYIRMIPAPDTLASQNLDKVQTLTDRDNNVSAATILAEIRQDYEMIQYQTPGEGHFFANLYQKSLNTLSIQITDSKNRLLPEFSNTQSSRGNRFFTVNFRADIIMDTAYGETPDPQAQRVFLPHIYPPRFDSNVLVNQRNGMPGYGRGPAY